MSSSPAYHARMAKLEGIPPYGKKNLECDGCGAKLPMYAKQCDWCLSKTPYGARCEEKEGSAKP